MLVVVAAIAVVALLLFVPFHAQTNVRALLLGLFAFYGAVRLDWLTSRRLGSSGLATYLKLLALFVACILASIVTNQRIHVYQDYVEISTVLIAGGSTILWFEIGSREKLASLFGRWFIGLCAVYLTVCAWQIVGWWTSSPFGGLYAAYATPQTVEAAALLAQRGESDRFAGLSSNPNAHAALLLLLFLAAWLTGRRRALDSALEGLCFVLVVFAQSRTGLIAMLAALSLLVASRVRSAEAAIGASLLVLLVIFLIVSLSRWLTLTFVESVFSENIFEHNSFLLRAGRWRELLEEALRSPVFGNAPRQEHFEATGAHFDSEYLLVVWRYGLLGLAAYLLVLVGPVISVLLTKRADRLTTALSSALFAATVVIGVTNVTLSDLRFAVFHSMIVGLCFGRLRPCATQELPHRPPPTSSLLCDPAACTLSHSRRPHGKN